MNFFQKVRNKIRRTYFDFQPYKTKQYVKGLEIQFLHATQQGAEWYDPIKPYARLEYEWVLENIQLVGQHIADCGAHHGHYSIILGKGQKNRGRLLAIDPMQMNCAITEVNLLLNGIQARIEECAVTTVNGSVHFSNQSNGFISHSGKMMVQGKKLSTLMPEANVVKLDIEGHEFDVAPQALNEMKHVHSWIVEVHPTTKHRPDDIIRLFLERGYLVNWVNRKKNVVEPYKLGTVWQSHSTIFATRKEGPPSRHSGSSARRNQQHSRNDNRNRPQINKAGPDSRDRPQNRGNQAQSKPTEEAPRNDQQQRPHDAANERQAENKSNNRLRGGRGRGGRRPKPPIDRGGPDNQPPQS